MTRVVSDEITCVEQSPLICSRKIFASRSLQALHDVAMVLSSVISGSTVMGFETDSLSTEHGQIAKYHLRRHG